MIENGCPVDDHLVNYAFAGGNLECLKYLHETVGCNWTANFFSEVGSKIHASICDEHLRLQCLEYAQAQGCPDDPQGCKLCARNGFLLLLQNQHERGCPWSNFVCRSAVCGGHLSCLKYAMDHGCPCTDSLIWHAVLHGQVEIISYLRQRGLPWPVLSLSSSSLGLINKEIAHNISSGVAHAYKLGCPPGPDDCSFAALWGFLDLLVLARQHGCALEPICTVQAACSGHLHCLTYLHEQGCPWDAESTNAALINKKYNCLKFAIEHGCPMSEDTKQTYEALLRDGLI